MRSSSKWLRVCFLLTFIGGFNSYVLLAADTDDFRNIAKKIVPETLADKLAELASDASVKRKARGNSKQTDYYYESEVEDDYYSDENEDIAEEDEATDTNKGEKELYVKEWNTRVNFDELVERVKDRLAKELSEKIKQHVLNTSEGSEKQSIYNNGDQKNLHSDHLKKTANKITNFGNIQNSMKPQKTYGYSSNSKSKSKSKIHENVTNNFSIENQRQEKNIYSEQILKNKHKTYKNDQNTHQVSNINEGKYEMEATHNYETPNGMLLDYSNEKAKGKLSHEEDNDSYHAHSNKDLIYGTKEVNFDKQYIKHNEYPKYVPEDEYASKLNDNKPVRYIYEDGFGQQSNVDQNVFASTDNSNKSPFYKQFDLVSNKKNDSYEDYVIPKDENIFESEEKNKPVNLNPPRKLKKRPFHKSVKSQFKVRDNGNLKQIKSIKNKRQQVQNEENIDVAEDYRDPTDRSSEIKAKTESLLYNYDDSGPKTIKDDDSKKMQVPSEDSYSKQRKPKGTMIPTREYFKMASPNYYISLPTVVEQYDPYEPLPEKDRKREVIKHFVNPPASINKKVKLM